MPERAVGDAAVGVAGPPQAVALTASPMTVTNLSNRVERYYITQQASATGTIAKAGITIASMTTPAATIQTATVDLGPGQSFVYTYNAGANTIARDVL